MSKSLSQMPSRTMFQVMVSVKFLNFKENKFSILKKNSWNYIKLTIVM